MPLIQWRTDTIDTLTILIEPFFIPIITLCALVGVVDSKTLCTEPYQLNIGKSMPQWETIDTEKIIEDMMGHSTSFNHKAF